MKAGFALLLAALAGCNARETTPLAVKVAEPTTLHAAHANVPVNAEVSQWLAQLRRAMAPFQRIEAAAEAGWGKELTPCMELPGTGGMGFHYANEALIDAVPQALAPELLVYAPQKNGRLHLVAVEFIVPFDAWTNAEPPALHGVAFHRNEAFKLWVLHAWIFKNNPAGIFADWNPQVSCEV